ncbi:MAG: hypothetical protein KatS3mg104_0425 [Phycisphaerae bacterium]|jgi:outer membrane biosynthesis protein TonB|nr:MAG: hypothetical protein KatS3mg104_0425 [Phycisphaerae bacterium]
MQQRSLIFPFLVVSLVLHAALILTMRHIPLNVRLQIPTHSDPAVHPVVLLSPEPLPEETRFGEHENTGLAMNALDAPVPQQTSRYAPVEQAMLSTDPVGQTTETPEETPSPVEISPIRPSEPSSRPPVESLQTTVVTPVPPEATEEVAEAPSLARSSPTMPAPDVTSDATKVSEPSVPSAQQNRSSGDPAPLSDRDSDVFGPSVSLEIVAGRVQPRSGRQLKFKRPRLNLAGFVDTAVISLPARALLEIEIDDTGTPRKVWIKRSTGSTSIDRAIELAAYESWFEPVRALELANRKERFEMSLTLH